MNFHKSSYLTIFDSFTIMLTRRQTELARRDLGHERLHEFLSVLSNRDSLRVFELASRGVIASKSTFEKMNLSRANYHRKVKQLRELGLVIEDQDEKGVYRQTPIGEIVYENQVVTLNRIAADNNIMEFISKFTLKNRSVNKNLLSAVRQITRELIESTDPGLSNLGHFKLFKTMQEYDLAVGELASNAKRELFIAARSLDLGKVDSLVRTAERGTRLNAIYSDWKGFYSKGEFDPLAEVLQSASQNYPRASQLLQANPNVTIKRSRIPYGFVVSDGLDVAIEAADPNEPESFFMAVGLENKDIAKKLVSYFWRLQKQTNSTDAS